MIFLFEFLFKILQIPLKSPSNSSFFRFGVEIRFLELQVAAICVAVVLVSFVFCNSVFADRSGMAASRFLAAVAACVVILCFAAESRKSHCM